MSVRLMVEVIRHAPACLTPTERYLLTVLAEDANDGTRISYNLGPAELADRVGVSERRLTGVFTSLAGKGLEVRIPLGTDARGRPVFAYHGRKTEYRIPPMPGRGDPPKVRADTHLSEADGARTHAPNGAHQRAASEAERCANPVAKVRVIGSEGARQRAPNPSLPLTTPHSVETSSPRGEPSARTAELPIECKHNPPGFGQCFDCWKAHRDALKISTTESGSVDQADADYRPIVDDLDLHIPQQRETVDPSDEDYYGSDEGWPDDDDLDEEAA